MAVVKDGEVEKPILKVKMEEKGDYIRVLPALPSAPHRSEPPPLSARQCWGRGSASAGSACFLGLLDPDLDTLV
jgi:hypothetical protein